MSSAADVTYTRQGSTWEQFFATDVERFRQCLIQLDAEIDVMAVPQRNDAFHQRLQEAFQASQDACREFEEQHSDSPALLLDAQAQFRAATEPWFCRSWIANRSRTKPSGFAGDFEMLNKLYAEQTPARGLGGYLDLCILDLPLARAVRARLVATRNFLTREVAARAEHVRILDIACGPCREYQNWPKAANGHSVEIVALDSDPAALAYVDAHVVGHLTPPDRLQATRYNALRTRNAAATTRKFGKFDIIYSVGLCDYLSDDHLIDMLRAWRDTLQDGGILYIAFKDTLRYDKTPYQWHLDWFFFQRTEQDVLKLYEAAGFDTGRIETTRDDTGIIINFIDRLRPGDRRRFDRAEQATPIATKSQRPASVSPRHRKN